jgi:hypothetical protein
MARPRLLPVVAAAAAGWLAGGDSGAWAGAAADGQLWRVVFGMFCFGAALRGSAGLLSDLFFGPREGTR